MEVLDFEIFGLKLIRPVIHADERGFFLETYHKRKYEEHGISLPFMQDNLSKSQKGVLRGLHFQAPPFDQAKLVQVIKGAVLDVAVDIRKNSKTYGKYVAVRLDDINKEQFYIPRGFAHGFLCLEDDTIFSYKCSNLYHKDAEGAIIWNDSTINIDWNYDQPIISAKDKLAEKFIDFKSPF